MGLVEEKKITVLSVSYFSAFHLNRLFNNLKSKADNPETLQFLVVDNTNGEDSDLYSYFVPDLDIQFISNSGKGYQRSVSHARALDIGLKKSETEFILIVDPDVHVFKAGWDTFCLNRIAENDTSVIGAPYPAWKLGKVHDYPSVVFMFFQTKQVQAFEKSFYPFPPFLKRIWNSLMRKITRLGILTSKSKLDKSERLRSITGWLERATGITSPDTGKEIIETFHSKGFTAVNFDAPYSGDLLRSGQKGQAELAKEFELFLFEGEPIMTHMYGSGVFHWKTEKGSDLDHWQELITGIEKYLQ